MSILIQFLKDHMALLVFTIIAAVVLIGSTAGIIVFHVKQKKLAEASSPKVSACDDREADAAAATVESGKGEANEKA